MNYIVCFRDDSNCLSHHGIKGQKWYVRRFQNEDGTLTPEGIKRYRKDAKREARYNGEFRGTSVDFNATKSAEIMADEYDRRVRDSYGEVRKILQDEERFYNDPAREAELMKYSKKIAEEIIRDHPQSGWTKERLDDLADLVAHDDLGQGDGNPYKRMLKDTGKFDSAVKAMFDFEKVSKKAISEIYGNYKISDLSDSEIKVAERYLWHLEANYLPSIWYDL